jgi:hypothetical protein
VTEADREALSLRKGRGLVVAPCGWLAGTKSEYPLCASYLPSYLPAASTKVFNNGLGLPSYLVARIQVAMSCNPG